uniref:Gustatory receptor n=1 Tax=Tetranychus urticae TaxID=32264 RepID=A0A158P549_TETUR
MSSPTRPSPPKRIILEGYILPSKYILGPAIKILLLFTTAFCPACRIVYASIYTLPLCNYNSKISIFDCVHSSLEVIILSLVILMVLFGFNLDYFKKFISTIELLSIEFNSSTVGTIKRNRRRNTIILLIPFISNVIVCMVYTESEIQNAGIFKVFLIVINQVCIIFGLFFFLNMTCNICICLQATFNEINSQIAALNQTDNQLFYSFHEIRTLRKKYSYAVRSTKNAEKLFRYFITIFYVEYFSLNIMNIVRSFEPETKIGPIWLASILIQTAQLLILTYNLVSVNNISRQGLEDLYEFSFKLDTIHLYHENDIFIARMALSDVGFTFANLFTINNSFITSMFTLSLTIIIALASFIYH